jgi:predicted exporter
MIRLGRRAVLALVWLVLVAVAVIHVGLTVQRGLPLQTDFMALLPREDRDPTVQQAKDAMLEAISQRIVILVGHREPAAARAAADSIERTLADAGLISPNRDIPDADAMRRMGALYFTHRAGLLAEADRRLLLEDRGADLLTRALSQIYGFIGMADSRLLAQDPFQLFPAFLATLPVPTNRLSLDDGRLVTRDDGTTWVLVTGQLTGKSSALAFERRFVHAFGTAEAGARERSPDLQILRLGAVFFAHEGARQGLAETSLIGGLSLAGAVLMFLLVFRRLQPLLLGVAAIAVGLTVALSVSLAIFGELHVAAQMFGASLIGIAADYSLVYFGQTFSPTIRPAERIHRVLPGIALAMLTAVVGYLTLLASPLPGLHQVAVFSAIGLCAAFCTVALWFPLLDRTRPRPMATTLAQWADDWWSWWHEPKFRRPRFAALVLLVLIGVVGLTRLEAEDDVRRQQALSPTLLAEQAAVLRLTGFDQSTQFYTVEAENTDQALHREEALGERLSALVAQRAIAGWRSPARFVPSAARQADNRDLVEWKLVAPHLAALRDQIGMPAVASAPSDGPLSLMDLLATQAIPLLPLLILDNGPGRTVHLVMLEGVRDTAALQAAADSLPGVRFVDPTSDLTDLFRVYRQRAIALLAASAALMLLPLAWRYGLRGGLRVLAPPAAVAALTPGLLALAGVPFTFFGAMALMLVLSMGIDYAIFCAEGRGQRNAVTLVSVALAMLTTLLSFGLLAFSALAGVRSFGLTMAIGLPLAFLLAPLAASAERRETDQPERRGREPKHRRTDVSVRGTHEPARRGTHE